MKDIIIIGGGPAGLAAGIYAARSGRGALLFESMYPGGQMTKTMNVENYPGFEQGVDGFSLAAKLEKQAQSFGLQTVTEEVVGVEFNGPVKRVKTPGKEYEAKAVIIATGASPRKLKIAREEELIGAGISYCATCDGAFFKNRNVAVIGGGDTAVADALYLAHFVNKVYVVHRRDALRATDILQKAAFNEPKIEFVWNSVPERILGDKEVTGLVVKNTSGEERELSLEGIFVAVGIVPNAALFKGILDLNEGGYIITDVHMNTSVKGVYAAGDVRNTPLRQIVTAVADGAVAATSAVEHIMI
ncbi:MAG TPA: thioredoxin-disulfide reductase [Clostridia bacterium]|nr:thioredoxin-disulfide reductase [Clostridia bacterium]